MPVPSIALFLICIFLLSMFVYIAVVYWESQSHSHWPLDNYKELWWNQRSFIFVLLALWIITLILPIGYFLLYSIFSRTDLMTMLSYIFSTVREDHRVIWNLWRVLGGVVSVAVCTRFVLLRINASNALLTWHARHYGTVLTLFAAAIALLSIW